jgi:hypothetical protein
MATKDAPGTGTQHSDNNPGTRGLAHAAALDAIKLCRDVFAGTRRMREEAAGYLPQFPKELDTDYAVRVGVAVLHNAFRRTVKGLAGMVFRKEVPDAILAHMANIDLAGRDLTEFSHNAFDDKLQAGHGMIFVDWHEPGEAKSRLAEKAMEARPFWVWIPEDKILRTPFTSVDGKPVLESFSYEATETERVGEFGEREVDRVRQYDLTAGEGQQGPRVLFRSWTKVGDGEWQVEETGKLLGDRMRRIPVAVDYTDRTGFMVSDTPLEDLAYLNIRHLQVQSERDTAIHHTCSPVNVIIGVHQDEIDGIVSSSTHGLVLPMGAEFAMVSAEGKGLEETRAELGMIEQRMATLGLSMLQRDARSDVKATTSRIEKSESDSRLASLARSTQRATREAMKLHGEWLGLPEAGEMIYNTDFNVEQMTPQMIGALANLVGEGHLSEESMWEMMIKGEVLHDSFDPELERERIVAEPARSLEAMQAWATAREPV